MQTNRFTILLCSLLVSMQFYGQSKLNRNQVLNAVRTHQNINDSVKIEDTDTIKCDARTTDIALIVTNDSTAEGYSYSITCNKDGIELSIFEQYNVIYKSCYDYSETNFFKLKSKINNLQIVKISSIKDEEYRGKNMIIRFFRDDKMYESIESFSGRTNASNDFYEVANTIGAFVPSIRDIITDLDTSNYLSVSDTTKIEISFSKDSVKLKAKGGEFKKIKVTCSIEDWQIIECPEWITYSLNKNDEIVLESKRNDEKKQREGDVVVQCNNEKRAIHITQKK